MANSEINFIKDKDDEVFHIWDENKNYLGTIELCIDGFYRFRAYSGALLTVKRLKIIIEKMSELNIEIKANNIGKNVG